MSGGLSDENTKQRKAVSTDFLSYSHCCFFFYYITSTSVLYPETAEKVTLHISLTQWPAIRLRSQGIAAPYAYFGSSRSQHATPLL